MKKGAQGREADVATFLAEGIQALCVTATVYASSARDPRGWVWVLLAMAAERAAYEARTHMTPKTFEATHRTVEAHLAGIRAAARDLVHQQAEGARIVADALSEEPATSLGYAPLRR